MAVNPEVQAVLAEIMSELDKLVVQRVQEALAKQPPPTHSGTPGVNVKFLAKQLYNLCMVTGMSVPKELVDMMK